MQRDCSKSIHMAGLKITEMEDGIFVEFDNKQVELDPCVPGISSEALTRTLSPSEGAVHIRWSRCKELATVLHLYDCFAVGGIPVIPEKKEAVCGWKELHSKSSPTSNLQADPAAFNSTQAPRPLVLANSFASLLQADDTYINHVHAICARLQFPLTHFERSHVSIASELFQRCANDPGKVTEGRPQPQVFVRSYTYNGVLTPLLVWYRIHETEILCMLQEFLHVRFPQVPGMAVWYWQLLPYYVNTNNVGNNFDLFGVLPSLNKLVSHAAVSRNPVELNLKHLQIRGQRLRDELHVEYGKGVCSLWLGKHVFFYVEREHTEDTDTEDAPPHQLRNVTTPANHRELPHWVLEFLGDMSTGTDAFAMAKNVDSYLAGMEMNLSPGLKLLRSINWASLPLVWNPLFMKNAETCVTVDQATRAQTSLIKGVCPSWEEAETMAEAIDLLNRITGVST